MDVKTLLAGYRPLHLDELERKLAIVAKSHQLLSLRRTDLDFPAYLQKLPNDLVFNHFGSNAFDAYYTYNACITNEVAKEDDVYYWSVVHYLIMMLTYQARFIGRRSTAECAVIVGGSTPQFCGSLVNANIVTGVGFVDATEYADVSRRFAEAFEGTADVLKNILLTDYDTFSSFIASVPAEVGLVALGDSGRIAEFNSVIKHSLPYMSENSFVCFSGRLDWVLAQIDSLSEQDRSLAIEVRPYLCNTESGPRERAVVVVRGLRQSLSLESETADKVSVRFVQVHGQASCGSAHFQVKPYGSGFTNHGNIETVVIKRPVVIKSTAPLPAYTRQAIEGPIGVGHYAALVRDGGIRHSADPFHSTYIYVTSRGEVIEDFNEPGQYLRSSVFRQAEGDGTTRKSTLDIGYRQYYRGQLIPLCFSPSAHKYHSHFLLQCFPRVLIAREICPEARFAVPSDLKRYQREMLELVGVGDNRLVPIYTDGTVFCDELIIPHLWPAIFSRYSERIYREIGERLGPSTDRPSRRILISREARTSWRNMVNFNTVSGVLTDEFGFEVVCPDKLSLLDEIKLFRNSALIAGAEGAGLYNCCFATEQSAVLNMADQDYVMYVVGSIAQIRGFDLGYVFGESFQSEQDLARRVGHTDFVIDPEALRTAAKQLIGHLEDRWGR